MFRGIFDRLPELACYLFIQLFNIVLFFYHLTDPYFAQLATIALILVVINWISFIFFQTYPMSISFSRLFIITLSIQTVVTLAFWLLWIFFRRGILQQTQNSTFLRSTAINVWMHGGVLISLLVATRFIKIQIQYSFFKKLILHLSWGVPFVGVQFFYFFCTGKHIYRFISYFSWGMLIVFEVSMFAIAILSDYAFTLVFDRLQIGKQSRQKVRL